MTAEAGYDSSFLEDRQIPKEGRRTGPGVSDLDVPHQGGSQGERASCCAKLLNMSEIKESRQYGNKSNEEEHIYTVSSYHHAKVSGVRKE